MFLESAPLAGFPVSLNGRFWASPEVHRGNHDASKIPNLPHTSGGSDNLQRRLDYIVSENIRRFGAGLPLLNIVDKKEGF